MHQMNTTVGILIRILNSHFHLLHINSPLHTSCQDPKTNTLSNSFPILSDIPSLPDYLGLINAKDTIFFIFPQCFTHQKGLKIWISTLLLLHCIQNHSVLKPYPELVY